MFIINVGKQWFGKYTSPVDPMGLFGIWIGKIIKTKVRPFQIFVSGIYLLFESRESREPRKEPSYFPL